MNATDEPGAPRLRPAVRGLVVDDDDRLLLVRLVFPPRAWWVLPGGGIDVGEDEIVALRRELREEVGLDPEAIGALLWHREHEFDLVDTAGVSWAGQRESVFLVRTVAFDPAPAMSVEELRAENLHEHRWWTVEEIESYPGPDFFAPRDLAMHVRRVLNEGPPEEPFVIVQRD